MNETEILKFYAHPLTVDGSEIRLTPVEVGSLSHYFTKVVLDVSENSGTPKSSILIGFSIINHPFWGTPYFGNTLIDPRWLPGFLVAIFPVSRGHRGH